MGILIIMEVDISKYELYQLLTIFKSYKPFKPGSYGTFLFYHDVLRICYLEL